LANARRSVSRSARAADLPHRAERAVGDLDDPAGLGPAFEGVEKLFLLTPGIGTSQAAHAVAAATTAGVRHIVLLSSANVLGEPLPAMGSWHHEREEIVRGSGIPATLLRPGGFMSNALDWVPTIRDGGYVLDPTGPGRFALIGPADLGAVAAVVLTEDGHEDKEYSPTGDRLLTVAERVQILADAVGRALEVRTAATPAEAVRSRFPSGAPEAILEGFTLMRADTVGFRTDVVERMLGRQPRSFADWCARNAGAFDAGAARAKPRGLDSASGYEYLPHRVRKAS
jgi:uncharacterized protein YbjT (DUF2867 family)